jgi:hypothetical protein
VIEYHIIEIENNIERRFNPTDWGNIGIWMISVIYTRQARSSERTGVRPRRHGARMGDLRVRFPETGGAEWAMDIKNAGVMTTAGKPTFS